MKNRIQNYTLALLFIVCTAYLGYVPQQSDFYQIIVPYSLLFLSYLGLLRLANAFSFLIALAVLARFILIFAIPNLSDDIYRFIWDGRLIHIGLSPYTFLPTDLVNTSTLLTTELYQHLNSPNYYSLYPPVAQLFNYLSTFIASESFILESTIYKSLLFGTDIVLLRVLYLLFKLLEAPLKHIFIYALNPLIIIEINGNVHFEGVLILFFAISLYYLNNNRPRYAGTALGLSVASKMLPLMYSLSMFCYTRITERKYLLIGAMISTGILFSPVLLGLSQDSYNILISLDLYLKKFEFNGSIYYLLRFIAYKIYGYNAIHVLGPILTVIALISILYISIKTQVRDYSSMMNTILWITIIFLLSSRTVHPWYLSLAIFSSIFTRFRFPIIWSYLIFFTYINYSYDSYHEHLLIVFIEYSILFGAMTYELISNKKAPSQ